MCFGRREERGPLPYALADRHFDISNKTVLFMFGVFDGVRKYVEDYFRETRLSAPAGWSWYGYS